MIALIQAGGAGTRLKSISGNLPKPMVKIGDKPILEWQLLSLKKSGITSAIIVISKVGEAIPNYFGDGAKLGMNISYIKEEEPLGSGGALFLAKDLIKEDFLLLFGDIMLDINWQKMIDFHRQNNALITCFAHPNSHPFDSDLLVTDSTDKITALDSKNNTRKYFYENITNAGLYVVSKDVLSSFQSLKKIDFEKDVVLPLISEGRVYAYRSSEYVKDCGTPDRFDSVTKDLEDGIISAKNLLNTQKAIFLDRDGTINKFGDYVTKSSMMELMGDAVESIKLINASKYLAICITNQPVIARGETTLQELHNIHNKMEDLLGEGGAYLNDLYFCPHYPVGGFPGEVKKYKIVCDCRKPKIGLLLKAQQRYNIDFKNSWFIGDTKQDVQTGINAGCRTVMLTCGDPYPNHKYKEATPNKICSSLLDAVKYILENQ
jgi:mannose-1-phosphate guanylyltransferase/phosphomannomutase